MVSNPDHKFKNKKPVITVSGLRKSYRKGKLEVPVLKGVDLSIPTGDFTTIIGTSGSGKSTLLHLMGLLDSPDVGEVTLEGQRIDDLGPHARDQLRNHVFGFIFQFYNLIPSLTAEENVSLCCVP